MASRVAFRGVEVEAAVHALVRADQHVDQPFVPHQRRRAVIVNVAEAAEPFDGQPPPEVERRQESAAMGRQ